MDPKLIQMLMQMFKQQGGPQSPFGGQMPGQTRGASFGGDPTMPEQPSGGGGMGDDLGSSLGKLLQGSSGLAGAGTGIGGSVSGSRAPRLDNLGANASQTPADPTAQPLGTTGKVGEQSFTSQQFGGAPSPGTQGGPQMQSLQRLLMMLMQGQGQS